MLKCPLGRYMVGIKSFSFAYLKGLHFRVFNPLPKYLILVTWRHLWTTPKCFVFINDAKTGISNLISKPLKTDLIFLRTAGNLNLISKPVKTHSNDFLQGAENSNLISKPLKNLSKAFSESAENSSLTRNLLKTFQRLFRKVRKILS